MTSANYGTSTLRVRAKQGIMAFIGNLFPRNYKISQPQLFICCECHHGINRWATRVVSIVAILSASLGTTLLTLVVRSCVRSAIGIWTVCEIFQYTSCVCDSSRSIIASVQKIDGNPCAAVVKVVRQLVYEKGIAIVCKC
jgi:hypothetical protein